MIQSPDGKFELILVGGKLMSSRFRFQRGSAGPERETMLQTIAAIVQNNELVCLEFLSELCLRKYRPSTMNPAGVTPPAIVDASASDADNAFHSPPSWRG